MRLSIKFYFFIIYVISSTATYGQTSGSFTVGGDLNKFYPVTVGDGGWHVNSAAEIQIIRSDIHENASWRGSLVAKFAFHTSQWGNRSNFIHSDIIQTVNGAENSDIPFIAGFQDATLNNSSLNIIIWLRGGGTTYHYHSVHSTIIKVYDGTVNPLPFQEINGPAHTFKTTVDPSLN